MLIQFNDGKPYGIAYRLYRLHNAWHDGQIVLVWESGSEYLFSFHDEPFEPRTRRDWVCVGELTWRADGDHFVHELHPLVKRSELELADRAKRTEAHKAYRRELWKRYSLEKRLAELK